MKHSLVLPGLLVSILVSITGCTSFAFKTTGKGSAPDELKDRGKMVRVEGRVFEMGANNAEVDEYPPHKVEVSGFSMDKHEVTLGEYLRCVEAKSCNHAPAIEEAIRETMTELHPVIAVSWYDAKKYCDWVGKRLPTEAEWELAARAPKFDKHPFSAAFGPTVVNGRDAVDGYERTAPVGSFPKGQSGLGLMDMAGNAGEWTSDWYDSKWYDKTKGANPKGPEGSTGSKTYRGGSWTCSDYDCRSTRRVGLDPNISNDSVGFRCVAD